MAAFDLLDVTTVVIFMTTLLLMFYAFSEPRNLPPGPRAWPVIGNILVLARNRGKLPDVFAQYAQQYGNIFRLKFGNIVMVVLNGYDLINEALVKKADVFSDRLTSLWSLKHIGIGVMMSSGQKWKDLRRLALQSMRDFGMGKATTEEKVLDEVKVIQAILSQREGKRTGMKRYLSMASSNIICSIIFGSRFDYDDTRFKRLLDAVDIMAETPSFFVPENGIPMLRWLPKSKRASSKVISNFKNLEHVVRSIVDEHRSTYDKENIRSFVDLYIRYQEEDKDVTYTDHEFLRLIMDLFIAGTETTATTLEWALLYMMAYPDIQIKCQDEIDRVVGSGRMIKQADKIQMPYIEATLSELQRISSIAPFALPHSVSEDTKLGGYSIPKGSLVIPNLMSVHMDPKLWPEPEKFKPERFLDDQGKYVKKEAYMPFSLGPRICVAETLARMELFLYFSNLLQCFTFKKPEETTLNLSAYVGVTRSAVWCEVIPVKR